VRALGFPRDWQTVRVIPHLLIRESLSAQVCLPKDSVQTAPIRSPDLSAPQALTNQGDP